MRRSDDLMTLVSLFVNFDGVCGRERCVALYEGGLGGRDLDGRRSRRDGARVARASGRARPARCKSLVKVLRATVYGRKDRVRADMPAPSARPDGDIRRAGIQVHALHGGVVISLSGDHDLSTKPRLIDALAGVRQEQWVVIDLQRCTFVDSTIIATILAACRRGATREPNVSVALPDDTSYVWRALSVVGLRDLVPAHLSIEAALEAVPIAEER